MFERLVALCAALLIVLLPVAWVSASTAGGLEAAGGSIGPAGGATVVPWAGHPAESLGADPLPTDLPPLPTPEPTPAPTPETSVLGAAAPPPAAATPPPPPPAPVVAGSASNYLGTAGFDGQATVALPGVMGGRYTGGVQGYATVCADRCVRLPVVDWCQCYWGTAEQRVADISHAAWPLISDQPLSRGLIQVQVILDDPALAAAWQGG